LNVCRPLRCDTCEGRGALYFKDPAETAPAKALFRFRYYEPGGTVVRVVAVEARDEEEAKRQFALDYGCNVDWQSDVQCILCGIEDKLFTTLELHPHGTRHALGG